MRIAHRSPFRYSDPKIHDLSFIFSYICIFHRNFALLICILNAACRKCIFIIRHSFLGPAKLRIQFRWKTRRSSAHFSQLCHSFTKRICKCIFSPHFVICRHCLYGYGSCGCSNIFCFFAICKNICFFCNLLMILFKFSPQKNLTSRHKKLVFLIFSQSYRNIFFFTFCHYFSAFIPVKRLNIKSYNFSCLKSMLLSL